MLIFGTSVRFHSTPATRLLIVLLRKCLQTFSVHSCATQPTCRVVCRLCSPLQNFYSHFVPAKLLRANRSTYRFALSSWCNSPHLLPILVVLHNDTCKRLLLIHRVDKTISSLHLIFTNHSLTTPREERSECEKTQQRQD